MVPLHAECWCGTEGGAAPSFGYSSGTASLFRPRCSNAGQVGCQAGLGSFPLAEIGGGRRGLEFLSLSQDGAIDVAQDRSLWRMTSTFGATHS